MRQPQWCPGGPNALDSLLILTERTPSAFAGSARDLAAAVSAFSGNALRPASRCDVRQAFLNKHAELEPHAELILDLSQRLNAQQRVTAHLKELVDAANGSSGMNQLRPYLGDRRLDGIRWSLMSADNAQRDDRYRKSAPINLAVWCQWNIVHRQEILRNHVLGKSGTQMLA